MPAAEMEQTTSAAPQKENALTVYYFHGCQRSMIEELTKQAIEAKYATEVAGGKIVFQSVNA